MDRFITNPIADVLIMFGLACVVVALITFSGASYGTVEFKGLDYDTVVEVLTPVLFVGLLVERLLEVFVSGGRKHKREPLERRLLKTTEKLAQLSERSSVLQTQLDAPGTEALSDQQKDKILDRLSNVMDKLPEAQRNLREAEAEMEKFRGKTRKIAYVIGTAMGLVIGLAGVRALAPIVGEQIANWHTFQQFAFHSVDVVLTAALLAGGAAGIHQVIAVFGDYTQKARKGAK